MRIVSEPKVYLVARPQVDWTNVERLLRDEYRGDAWERGETDRPPDQLCEFMGRLCYGSFGKRQGRVGTHEYLGHVMDVKHGSILEHACWSFVVTRCSRGFTHQMVRHRAGFGFSQESTHFVRYAEGGQEPTVCTYGVHDDEVEMFLDACRQSFLVYDDMYSKARLRGLKHKQACASVRGLVPTAAESRLGFTANARALRWFVELRGEWSNVPEIRCVAAQVVALLKVEAPALFGDLAVGVDPEDGFPIVSSTHSKV